MANLLSEIPEKARALTSIGDKTTKAVRDLFNPPQGSLFPPEKDNPDFVDLSDALRKRNWSDDSSAELFSNYGKGIKGGRDVPLKRIIRWVLAHEDGGPAESIIDCMQLVPPEQIEIIKVLSRKGSQKVVFLASWRFRQQEVVLKKIIGELEDVNKILDRELQPHPFTMIHSNIVETHILKNNLGESFLVEKRLHEVLHDDWEAGGVHEAANLLFDIAKALRFLHDNENKIHGDIKPDNIGKRDNDYVLLDFGICRPKNEFKKTSTPTGSLRTRAPELLDARQYVEPEKVDIWALGATVYNSLAKRFPFISSDEDVPRISSPQLRAEFEAKLGKRVEDEWDKWVDFSKIPEILREILHKMLERDLERRVTASELIAMAEKELSAFLRSSDKPEHPSVRFSPMQELEQIGTYLLKKESQLLPDSRKKTLISRLQDLKRIPGFDDNSIDNIGKMVKTLS